MRLIVRHEVPNEIPAPSSISHAGRPEVKRGPEHQPGLRNLLLLPACFLHAQIDARTVSAGGRLRSGRKRPLEPPSGAIRGGFRLRPGGAECRWYESRRHTERAEARWHL